MIAGSGRRPPPDYRLGHAPIRRFEDGNAALPQQREVRLGRWMFVHLRIHCRSNQDRGSGRKRGRCEQIVTQPGSQACDCIGGGRSNHQQVGVLTERHVPDDTIFRQCPHIIEHRSPGQCLKRRRADKALRGGGHDNVNNRAIERQITC
jgi:hypothetical protein